MKKALYFVTILIVLVLGLSVQLASAQLPSLKTSVDRKEIVIGEYLKYSVEAAFPTNTYRLNWFNVPDSFSHFEVVSRGKIDSIEHNGTLICRQTLTLTSFDSGLNTIPSLNVNFESFATDSVINLFTDSIPINVSFSPLDSSKTFHDIKSIIEVKDETPLWVWIAAASLLILLILLIVYVIKYFKKRKTVPPVFTSKLSPYDEAIQSLEQLQKDQLLFRGEVKQFHTKLSDIFKRYLSRKMERNMLNHTSSEILLALNDTLLLKENTALIANSLRMSDAVKFAKYYPHKEESESALNDVRKVIDHFDKLIFK
ncbi:MAG: hypothetical protein M3004_03815 [Bacteroidota bacterium]|nr:hypothetical protein [Bacteroidota bacterium]